VVGYNEVKDDSGISQLGPRTGSHNVIIGPAHAYLSFGGLVAGALNTISAPHASVSGGFANGATGYGSSVSGGLNRSVAGTTNWAAGLLFETN
jgi:hypothetical protein